MIVQNHDSEPPYLTFCITDKNYIIDVVIYIKFSEDLPDNVFIGNDNRLYLKSLDDEITFKININDIIMDNNIFYVDINDKLVYVDKMFVQPNDINLHY